MTTLISPDNPAPVKPNLPLRRLREIAGDLQITVRTMKRWNKKYRIPRIMIGQTLYYDPAVVMDHLQRNHGLGGAR